jgi:hypothetical protein
LSAVAWLTLVQIGFNLYPILQLRWVRVRMNRLQLCRHRFERSRVVSALS